MRLQQRTFRRWHQWLALFVGLQMLVWSLSGAYMVWLQLPFIHGTALTQNPDQPLTADAPVHLLAALPGEFPNATQLSLVRRPLATGPQDLLEVTDASGTGLVDANTLTPVTPTKADIEHLATRAYTGAGTLKQLILLNEAPAEVNHLATPLWQAQFDDHLATHLYLDAGSGRVLSQRHEYWRWFDIMWMLHIMDYDTRSDISTPWLRIFILGNLLFVITGAVILAPTFKRLAKSSSRRTRRRQPITIRAIHKWTSILLMTQVMIWGVTGFYFSWLGHQRLAANDYFQSVPAEPLQATTIDARPALDALSAQALYRVGLQTVAGEMQLQLESASGTQFYHANGSPWQTDRAAAQVIAESSYTGSSAVADVRLKAEGEPLLTGAPVYQVRFADALDTRVYVDAGSGALLDHQNSSSGITDWMFRLHFMDYSGGRDFNNLIITAAAMFMLWFALSGVVLLIRHFPLRRRKTT